MSEESISSYFLHFPSTSAEFLKKRPTKKHDRFKKFGQNIESV